MPKAKIDVSNLWGEAFEPLPDSKAKTASLLEKIAKPKKVSGKKRAYESAAKTLSVPDILKDIEGKVSAVLGHYRDRTVVIEDRKALDDFISAAGESRVLAVDTETNNSLDPLTCKIMGLCLYSPGQKQAYVPINHADYISGVRLPGQLTEEDVKDALSKAEALGCENIMHNGKFDYEVLKCTCGFAPKIYWDTMIAAKLIDENERSAGLKQQYIDKIDPEQGKYSIDKLFDKVLYEWVDPKVFALYSAADAYMTYELYAWQKAVLEKPDMAKVLNLLLKVEMPVVPVVAEMELTGVGVDQEYAVRLHDKYAATLAKIDTRIQDELSEYSAKIAEWRLTPEANAREAIWDPAKPLDLYKSGLFSDVTDAPEETGEAARLRDPAEEGKAFIRESKFSGMSHSGGGKKVMEKSDQGMVCGLSDTGWYKRRVVKSKSEQLEDPINLGSPLQLAIFLYDVLRLEPVSEKSPRGTGEEVLKRIDLPVCRTLLERRGVMKLMDAFIDALPQQVSAKDGRIHATLHSLGTVTGRFSNSAPNLQQIPSHNKEIRMLFKAAPGYMMVGSDFSQQEPRLLSFYSRDENMIGAYKAGKDQYASIATGVYHNAYEDNLEHKADGSDYEEGAKRRSSVKSILLGIMYGRGVAAIAEQIHGTLDDAQRITDGFYASFPKVKAWMDATVESGRRLGYVEDFMGRRRHLPDLALPKYEITDAKPPRWSGPFNPLLGSSERHGESPKVAKYRALAAKVRSRKESLALRDAAAKDGVIVKDNTGFISQAERQCVNARIQGGAATMTKIAMAKIYSDPELNSLGFRLMIGVHDELIGECPEANAQEAADRLSTVMKTCVQDGVDVPFKCDAEIERHWYENKYADELEKEYEDGLKGGLTDEESRKALKEAHTEISSAQADEMLRRKGR